MTFDKLVLQIQQTNTLLQQNAVKAVNMHLTFRNWLIGFYIVEFEQNGSDRAEYGAKLLENIAKNIKIKGLTPPELSRCRQFYNTYPQIIGLIAKKMKGVLPTEFLLKNKEIQILGSLTQELQNIDSKVITQENNASIQILGTASQELQDNDFKHYPILFQSTSYSHFTELIKIEDITKRRFYELLILKTQPSIRELKRQIDTLTFERMGLSENHKVSFDEVLNKIQPQQTSDLVKSHYFFEFLNLRQPDLIEETDLEEALISNLQQFITELGNGFCLEARQKRILIGDEYFFIDLVFYHRILKCHILVELKTDKAKHEHIGQLKAYLHHYKKNIQEPSDNPPVGILIVTNQNKTLVEYAIADSDMDIFVSKYQLTLPKKSELEAFINNELKNNQQIEHF